MLYDRAARDLVRMEAQNPNVRLGDEQMLELFNRILARHREAVLTCTHDGLHRINLDGICDTCVYMAPNYLMRNCGCPLEVCLWCSKVILNNDGMLTGMRGLYREFMSRGYIQRLDAEQREQRWNDTLRKRYELRLARLQALARQEAPQPVLARDDTAPAQQALRGHAARQDRRREVLRAVGADIQEWERRFVSS